MCTVGPIFADVTWQRVFFFSCVALLSDGAGTWVGKGSRCFAALDGARRREQNPRLSRRSAQSRSELRAANVALCLSHCLIACKFIRINKIAARQYCLSCAFAVYSPRRFKVDVVLFDLLAH